MSKIHQKSGQNCLVCVTPLLDTDYVILHKTRRQTHCLCHDCFVNYFKTLLPKIKNTISGKYIDTIRCPGSYNSNHRNQCSHPVKLLDIHVSEWSEIYNDLTKIQYAMSLPNVFLCPNHECSAILEIDPTYPFNKISCHSCKTSWCKQCLRTPFHDAQTCLEAELFENKEEGAQFINEQIKQGKIKLCPKCKSPIYRPGGCNKMLCEKCGNKFCWLCGESDITYSHFNENKGGGCANKLWENTN